MDITLRLKTTGSGNHFSKGDLEDILLRQRCDD